MEQPLAVDQELREICLAVLSRGLSENDWALIESDDTISTHHYSGGFDATEMAFCFSFLHQGHPELWFQFTLSEAEQIAAGSVTHLQARLAEL